MEIFSSIPAELALLAEALFMGAGMFFAYDCLRIFRRLVPHGIFWISVEDILYWIAAAGWFFLRICKVNDGIIRFYVLLGVALGAALYYALLGRFLMKYASLGILKLKKQLKKAAKSVTMRVAKFRKREDGA